MGCISKPAHCLPRPLTRPPMQTFATSTLDLGDIEFSPKLQFLFEPFMFKVLYGGRDSMKSWSAARATLIQGLQGTERYLFARELQTSIADSVHRLLADQVSLLKMNYLYEVQQQAIIGVGQAAGTSFAFEGIRHNTSKIKSYEGITKCVVEEGAKLSKESFNILVPTIIRGKPGKEIWIIFNPELEEDFIYQHFVVREPPPQSKVQYLTYRDNPWLSPEALALILRMKETDPDEYLHVYEGHPKQILEGAVFAQELRAALTEGRLLHVPVDRAYPVHVFFDLGRSDHTSMWFAQQIGFEWHIVDFYQNKLNHIDHYLRVMQKRGYLYGLVWLPHDAKAQTLGTKMSVEEQVREAGYQVRIVPRLKIADRINAARSVFPSCYFDEIKCKEGLQSLRNYKYTVDARGHFSAQPVHDWASDAADAFCYFGVASKQRVRAPECKLELPKSTLVGRLGEFLLPSYAESDSRPSSGWLGR